MKIAITGLGLIGGSLAAALRASKFKSLLIGVDNNPDHCAKALEMDLVDYIMPLSEALDECTIMIVATPVNTLPTLITSILDVIEDDQIVIDVGSTKGALSAAVANHPNRKCLVLTHPMAGTEYSGPEAALADLFQGKCCVFCEPELSYPDAVEMIRRMYRSIGMHFTTLNAADHDLHTAYVSHISHIASFALALTVLEKEKEENRIFELASGGFSSTVRLAKSNPDTWIPIFEQNRDHVLDVLDEFINTVSQFRTLLIKKDFQKFHELMQRANDIKRIIDKKR